VVQPIIVETSEAEPDVVRLREIELVEVTGKSQESVSYTPVEISPVEIVEKTPDDSTVPELKTTSKISADKSKRLVSTRIANDHQKKDRRSDLFLLKFRLFLPDC